MLGTIPSQPSSERAWTLLLIVSVIFGLFLRLQNFYLLPIDGHAMRQTDTESVAYNLAFSSKSILYPQNSLIRPVSNKDSFFFLEFPAYQYSISLFYRLFGWHIEIARIINLILYLISAISLFWFTKTLFKSTSIGYFTAFFFVFAPGSIFFLGHAIHPDVFAVCTYLISLSTFMLWKSNRNKISILASLFSLALSVATRPFIMIGLPAFLYLLWTKKATFWEYLFYLSFAPSLFVFWKIWQIGFKSADSSWENWVLGGRIGLFTYETLVNKLILKNIVGEVMGKVTSFFSGLGLLLLAINRDKSRWFIFIWLLFIPIYWLIVPNGNIVHQYYADIYLVPIAMMAGYGLDAVFVRAWSKNKLLGMFFLTLVTTVTIYNGYRTSRYYLNDIISSRHQQIANEIDKVIPETSKIVYLAWDNSIPFSMVHRKGWMLGHYPVDLDPSAERILSMKGLGAEYIVSGNDNTDLHFEELKIIIENTDLIYSSEYIRVYKYR